MFNVNIFGSINTKQKDDENLFSIALLCMLPELACNKQVSNQSTQHNLCSYNGNQHQMQSIGLRSTEFGLFHTHLNKIKWIEQSLVFDFVRLPDPIELNPRTSFH